MAEAVVYVIDRVVTRPGQARAFVDRYLAEYAPPIWFDDAANTVTITWTLPTAPAWWQMTWQGRPDPALGQWWSQIGELVSERSRSVAAPADAVDGLGNV